MIFKLAILNSLLGVDAENKFLRIMGYSKEYGYLVKYLQTRHSTIDLKPCKDVGDLLGSDPVIRCYDDVYEMVNINRSSSLGTDIIAESVG